MKVAIFFLSLVLCLSYNSFSQSNFDFYLSNTGSNDNTGTSPQSPRQTLTGSDSVFKKFASLHGSVNIGLLSGNIFNEAFLPSYPVQIGTYYDIPGNNAFAILNGSDVYDTGWIKVDSTENMYRHDVNLTGFVGNAINGFGNYSYIYAIEIDTQLEKTAPITARYPLQFVSSMAAADTTPGSFYEPVTTNPNFQTLFIHTSNGNSPNLNPKYQYEISVRGKAINDIHYGSNIRFENLWSRGYGAGFGMLPGGNNSYYNNMIFGPGAAIHHVPASSGTFNHSLFLPGPQNTDYGAIVFYDVQGLERHNRILNTMFLDIPRPIYTHTSYGTNYGAIELDSVITFSGYSFLSASNTDTAILNNVYTDSYYNSYFNGSPYSLTINNCYFKDNQYAIMFSAAPVTANINNIFARTNVAGIQLSSNNYINLTNSIIHATNPLNGLAIYFIESNRDTSTHLNASGNIFISDNSSNSNYTQIASIINNGLGTIGDTWKNNVYIVVNGNGINWQVINKATTKDTTVQSFAEWQKISGQDSNSLFFDLRSDTRGLKAIFVDPANGDYDLANTPEADEIRAIKAGMTNPITCFLTKPTYEQAADIIVNNDLFTINSCRNPCLESNIRVNFTFIPSVLNNKQIQLQWDVAEQQNTDHYEIQRAIGNSNFVTIDSKAVSTDTLYSFIDDDIKLNELYSYRLVVVAKNGNQCYSQSDTIRTIANHHLINIYPNPSVDNIQVSLSGYTGFANFIITNSIGQTVVQKEAILQNGATQLFNLSNKAPGLYYLKLETIDGAYMERFIIN